MNRYMRWGVLPLVAALFSALCSCNPEEAFEKEDVISPEIEGTESGGLVKMEFVGALSEEGASAEDDAEGRTYLSAGNHVYWRGSDKIGVIDTQSPYVHEFDNTDAGGGAVCRFIGEAKAGESTWTVVYPASAFAYLVGETNRASVTIPAEQTAVLGGFADGSYITYCRTSGKSFTMTPLLSMFKIHISYENLTKIKVMSRENRDFTGAVRPLAGTFRLDYTTTAGKLNFKSDSAICMGTESDVTLLPPAGNDTFPIGDYYIPVAPLGDTDGTWNASLACLRLEFTRSDGQIASRTASWDSENKKQLKRGKYFDLGNVDEGLAWGYFDIEFATAGESYEGTSHLNWPFLTYRTSDDGIDWTDHDAPADLSPLRTNISWDLEGKLPDSGHLLRFHAVDEGATKEKVRYADQANAIYLNGHPGSYIEFPALQGRHLLRVEVQYDSTTVHSGGTKTGYPYLAGHQASDCPHITDTDGKDIDYVLSRDADSFHHNYNLFGTADNTAYRYVIAYESGTTWDGPRIQRIRLYYSHESRALTLPEPVLTSVSTTLRRYRNILTLTAADAASAGAYDVGIVVRNALEEEDGTAPEGHRYDRVIPLTLTPEIDEDGVTMTYSWFNSLAWSGSRYTGDPGLSEENEVYAYVRKFGDTTDPRTMTVSEVGVTTTDTYRTSALTHIQRPTYDWRGTSSDLNYVYADDSTVKLTASFTVTADSTQAYDCGFIYKTLAGDDDSWNYTKLDQNGTEKANITGYTMENGDSRNLSATLTKLTPGTVYVYKPVAVQHLACKFDDGTSGESSETYLYKYVVKDAAADAVTLAGPVVTVTTSNPSGSYVNATNGSILNTADITVSHLDPALTAAGARFSTGWAYGATPAYLRTRYDSKAIGTGTFSNGVWSGVHAYNTNRVFEGGESFRDPVYLTGLTDSDGATVNFRPYFAFVSGEGDGNEGVKYTPVSNYGTITCPTVSVPTSGDYLWRTATSADLMGTIAISDSNCKMEIGYSTDGGVKWTAINADQTAGSKTISSATGITEGGQTVKFGARRRGSADASTWKSLNITLGQPITSVYTYGSSYWTSNSSVTVSGSYTLNKVASNTCVQYGVQYFLDSNRDRTRGGSETLYTKTVNGTGATPAAYYSVDLDENVSGSVNSNYGLIYWFFARLTGSESTPGAVNTRVRSSMSSTLGSHTFGFGSPSSWDKRIVICFNTFYSAPGGYINPFLPTTASGFVSELGNSILSANGGLYQNTSAKLTGGHNLKFNLTSSSAYYVDANTALSGVAYNSTTGSEQTGALRVYCNSLNEFIGLPAISGHRVSRVTTWSMYEVLDDYFKTASPKVDTLIRIFYSSNDRSASSPTTGFNSSSGTQLYHRFEMRQVSGSFSSYGNVYNGTSLYMRFSSQNVSVGTYPNSSSKPKNVEARIRCIAIDYQE